MTSACSPGNADPRLRLVIVKYLDNGRQRFVKIHVDFDKSAVQSQSKYEAQRVKKVEIDEKRAHLHEVPVDKVADKAQRKFRWYGDIRVRLQCRAFPSLTGSTRDE